MDTVEVYCIQCFGFDGLCSSENSDINYTI